jgi:outer membrane protein OmpA-like peptidoglycan-associated protein
MNRAARCGGFLVATTLICAAATGCHRGSAQVDAMLASARKSYEPLEPQVSQLHGMLAGLHHGADELAVAVPGGQEWRAKLLATDEVLGVADARTKWVGGQLEEAAKTANTTAKKKEELAELADQVAKTAADLGQVSAAALELTHEKARLERVGALLKAPYERTLPGGFRIKGATSGVEARLLDFIQDGKKKTGDGTWFDFDRLQFFSGGADVDFPKSRDQLQNVVEILKAYPTVKLKVGGYTDSGPPAETKKLSTDRAEAVRTALIQMGIKPTRLEAHGYGAERPICPANDTEFCRAQNRRIAVQVTAITR